MKKVILPTDFSENSWNAIQYAVQLFKNTKCTFSLVNTYTPKIYSLEYMEINSAKFGLLDSMKMVSENGLQRILDKIQKQYENPKHNFIKISSFNTLVNEISELCLDNTIDYIVMGTKGATGLKEVLLGSNAIHVLKNVKCPVLAIPSNFTFEPLHEILFPSDYNLAFQKKHINPLLDLTAPFLARINILHVSKEEKLSIQQEKNKKKLELFFNKHAHIFHNVSKKSIPEAIDSFQLKFQVNLLVMINNKHSFFEKLFFKSTINQIGFHLNIPFLVIPS